MSLFRPDQGILSRSRALALGIAVAVTTFHAPRTAAETPEPAWLTKTRATHKAKEPRSPADLPKLPPVKTRTPAAEWDFGKWTFRWSGVAGGHCGGAERGSIGNWALGDDGRQWRQIEAASAVLDPLCEKCRAAARAAKDAEATARNVFYQGLSPTEEAKSVKRLPAELAAKASATADDLAQALAAAKATGWEKEGIDRAAVLVAKAQEGLRQTRTDLAAGKLDADVLKACFEAQWTLDEAAACLACEPGPREFASAIFEPQSGCVVLFGGSHHDYMMSDTWIYDTAKRAWRQLWPQTAPSPRMGATMKLLPGKGQIALADGQTVLNKMTRITPTTRCRNA